MARQIAINIVFRTQQAISRITKLSGVLRLLASAFRAIVRTFAVAGAFLAVGFVIGSLIRTFNRLRNAIFSSIKQFTQLEFQTQLTAAVIVKEGYGITSTFERISKFARETSTQVMYSMQQIQEGLYTAAIAGYNYQESIQLTSSAMKLSQIAGISFQSTINSLIGVTKAFSFELKKLPQIADVITAAFTHSKMTLQDFFVAVRYAAAAANTAFGSTMETFIDTTSALMTLSNSGLEASKAGVYLRGSIQKLMGATNRAITAFAKYNVNIYDSQGASSKYFGTLVKGQKILAGLYDELDALKKRQFELVLAGRDNSEEYKNLEERLLKLQTRISRMRSGLDRIFESFRLAGGRLKPLHEILKAIGASMPIEVVGRLFGIRGGQAIQILLQHREEFEKNRQVLEKYYEASQQGMSVLGKMFQNVLNTVLVYWQRIKNTVLAIANTIWQVASPYIKDWLKLVLDYFQRIYKWAEANKNLIRGFFRELFSTYKDISKTVLDEFLKLLSQLKDILAGKKEFPLYSYAFSPEGILKKERIGAKKGGVLEGITVWLQNTFSLLRATLDRFFKDTQEIWRGLGHLIVEGAILELQAKMEFFKSIGKYIAEGFLEGLRWWSKEHIKTPTEKTISGAMKPALGAMQGIKDIFDFWFGGFKLKPLAVRTKGTLAYELWGKKRTLEEESVIEKPSLITEQLIKPEKISRSMEDMSDEFQGILKVVVNGVDRTKEVIRRLKDDYKRQKKFLEDFERETRDFVIKGS